MRTIAVAALALALEVRLGGRGSGVMVGACSRRSHGTPPLTTNDRVFRAVLRPIGGHVQAVDHGRPRRELRDALLPHRAPNARAAHSQGLQGE